MAIYTTTFPNTEDPMSEGGAFTAGQGSMDDVQEASGQARPSVAGAAGGGGRLATPLIGGGQFVQGLLGATVLSGHEVGLMTRIQGTGDASGYYYALFGDLSTRLHRFDDTGTIAGVQIGSNFANYAGLPWFRMESLGASHLLSVNGILMGLESDATYATGQPGMYLWANPDTAASALNDWSAGDISVFSPVVVGTSASMAATASSGATVTPALPAGYTPVADDIAVVLAHHSGNGPWNTPTDYTIATDGTTTIDDNNTTAQRVTVFWKRLVGGESAPAMTLVTNTVTTVRGAILLILRNCWTGGTPFEVCDRLLNAASATTLSFPSVTTAIDHDLILALGAFEDDPSARTTPTGWMQPPGSVFTSALGSDMALNYFAKYQDAAGATGSFTTTVSGGTFASSVSVGAILAFRPEAPVGRATKNTRASPLGIALGMSRGMAA